MKGRGKGNDERVVAAAWTNEVMARQDKVKALDDYLRPRRWHIDLEQPDALAASLDRMVIMHDRAAPRGSTDQEG